MWWYGSSHYAYLIYHWHRLYHHLQAWNSFLHVCLRKDWGPRTTWNERPLLHVERSQLRWFGPRLGCLPDISLWEYCLNSQLGEDPPSQARTHWRDYISYLAGEILRIPQAELEDVAGEKDFASPAATADKDGWTDKTTLSLFELLPLNFVQEGNFGSDGLSYNYAGLLFDIPNNQFNVLYLAPCCLEFYFSLIWMNEGVLFFLFLMCCSICAI